MEQSEFEKLLSVEGKRIFQGFKEMDAGDGRIKLKETPNGFHLCFKSGPGKEYFVEFIQIWASPLDRLETRFNYVGRKVDLPVRTKDEIRERLHSVWFDDTSGSYGNMRLKFKELPRPLGEGNMKALMDAISSSISLLRECRPLE